MPANTPQFLNATLHLLGANGIKTWVFGGWAEELQKLIEQQPHKDIDLLHPAANFSLLGTAIKNIEGMTEVRAKRFSHKRAVMYCNVMVEFFYSSGGKKVTSPASLMEDMFFTGPQAYCLRSHCQRER